MFAGTAIANKAIALIGCNSFYASCERVFWPDLARTPIVVLSNNDACAIALSAAAERGLSGLDQINGRGGKGTLRPAILPDVQV